MILVVGATGLLGGEICRLPAAQQSAVRALVRETSSPEKVARLQNIGIEAGIAHFVLISFRNIDLDVVARSTRTIVRKLGRPSHQRHTPVEDSRRDDVLLEVDLVGLY